MQVRFEPSGFWAMTTDGETSMYSTPASSAQPKDPHARAVMIKTTETRTFLDSIATSSFERKYDGGKSRLRTRAWISMT
jgi:hypothetical protein